jgi:hypothetical protein
VTQEVEFCEFVPADGVDFTSVEPSKEKCQHRTAGLEYIRMSLNTRRRLEFRAIMVDQRSWNHERLWHALVGADLNLLLITSNQAP